MAPSQAVESRRYTEEERERFRTDPEALLAYRKTLESGLNGLFGLFIAESIPQKLTAESMTEVMRTKLQNKGLEQFVVPTFPVGCRRFTPGVNYLETLGSDKVELVNGEIEKITEKGLISATDGQEHPVDVLICATGFNTSYRPRFPLIGAGGKNLADVWANEPKSYFGMAAHDFPNYFMVLGPNSPIGNGPVLIAIGEYAFFVL